MVTIWVTKRESKDGCISRRVYARVTGETVTPLDALVPNVPERSKFHRRTGERVRVNRSGTWAVWACVDRRK